MAGRTLLAKLPSVYIFSRSFASRALPLPLARYSPLLHLRPLTAAATAVAEVRFGSAASAGFRCFSTRPTTSSLNDPSPNWSNRPPKETILLDGCDFEHWLVVMDPPDPAWTRDEIIDSFIKTLAQALGSEEEARMSIYSVSTKHYFAFGCKVSEELSYKIKSLAKVRWVLPDSYLDVKNKDYGGEPFIDGKAVPYDPKYHEEWVRNNARAQERSRRNDRPRNFDRSRNFERRRENMQNFQNREAPPAPNQGFQNPMPPRDVPPPSNSPPNYHQNQMPNQQSGYMPPNPAAGYQGSNQGYQGVPGYQGGQGYQGGGGHPGGNTPGGPAQGGQGYQGGGGHPGGNMPGGPAQGGQGYQGGSGHPGGNMPGGPAQGGQGYQGGGGHPGGNMPGGPAYHGGGSSYQGPNPGYQGNSQPYQGGFSGYQPSNSGYHGGPPNYQQGAPSYQGGGASPYPERDVPGRDQ